LWRRSAGSGGNIFVKGKSIKEVTWALSISRNTVRKVLRAGEITFAYEREIQRRPKLGRWAEALDRLQTANAMKSARERAPPYH